MLVVDIFGREYRDHEFKSQINHFVAAKMKINADSTTHCLDTSC